MRIKITTRVASSLKNVKEGFTENLFMSLNPPFPPVKLIQFGGCEKGDVVELELNFLFFKQRWKSDITEDELNETEWFFIDKGVKLPFFLKSWEHRHVVKKADSGSDIIDDIRFRTGTILTDFIMYPALLLQFLYRKPIYKKLFKE